MIHLVVKLKENKAFTSPRIHVARIKPKKPLENRKETCIPATRSQKFYSAFTVTLTGRITPVSFRHKGMQEEYNLVEIWLLVDVSRFSGTVLLFTTAVAFERESPTFLNPRAT